MGYVVNMRLWRRAHNRPPQPMEHRAAERIAVRLLVSPEEYRVATMQRVLRLAGHQGFALVTHTLDATLAELGRYQVPGGVA
jgi:hypothetical protein